MVLKIHGIIESRHGPASMTGLAVEADFRLVRCNLWLWSF
jgi:hypothetical protein